jgi:hypothetical protein
LFFLVIHRLFVFLYSRPVAESLKTIFLEGASKHRSAAYLWDVSL